MLAGATRDKLAGSHKPRGFAEKATHLLAKDIGLIGLTLRNVNYNNNFAHSALPGPLGPIAPALQIRPSF